MSAKINIRHTGGVTILDVSGRITLGDGSVTLRDAVQEAIKSTTKKLILDMSGVSYMDSSGWRVDGRLRLPEEQGLPAKTASSDEEDRRSDANH